VFVQCRTHHNREYSARLSKITQVLSNWHIFQRAMRPQTKHINIKYHHFREHVCLGLIEQSTPYFYLRTACFLIYSPSHSHRTHFSSSGRLCCTISEFTCFINSYWIRSVTLQWTYMCFSIIQSKLMSILHVEPIDKRIVEPIVSVLEFREVWLWQNFGRTYADLSQNLRRTSASWLRSSSLLDPST
jgi:hypothetical protein